MRVCVIGAGVSGLTAAYFLSRAHEVQVLESAERVGGHTHTVLVPQEGGRPDLPIDTGFIVHNRRTYPLFLRLMAELGVATQPSDMSFSVSDRATGREWGSRGVRGFFARRRNLLSPRHWGLLREIVRFNRAAPLLLEEPGHDALTLGDYLARERFSAPFIEDYLIPMAGAVWSMEPAGMMQFPAATLIRFFDNHGFLGLDAHHPWFVLQGGSGSYLEPLTAPLRRPGQPGIRTSAGIQSVARHVGGVRVSLSAGEVLDFEEVVFACHGDQILPLLADPTDREREVLSGFATSGNDVWLHTDASVMPRRRDAWASWNVLQGGQRADAAGLTLTYDMTRLQTLDAPQRYFVTLNGAGQVDEAKVLRRLRYRHPRYTLEAVRSQARWGEISGHDHTHFCGAYWKYGFHEDGVWSGLRVAESLGVRW